NDTGKYWNGTSFVTNATEIFNSTTLVSGNWSYAFDASKFPADGHYIIHSQAKGAGGATQQGFGTSNITYDNTKPTSAVTSPSNGVTFNAQTWDAAKPIQATTSDSLSGVKSVDVSIFSSSASKYWDGTAFNSVSEVFKAATLSNGVWTYNFP